MKLIKELHEVDLQILTEEKDGRKDFYIEGIYLQSNIKNRNKRVYPGDLMERKVNDYDKNYIQQNRAWGELGHPDNPSINLERVSHLIVSLKREGDNWIGKSKVVDTDYGRIVKSLLSEGGKLGVSSRGLGSVVTKESTYYVQEDFRFVTVADVVADPSAPDAFVDGIMEGKEWVWDNGLIREKQISDYKTEISGAPLKRLKMVKLSVWNDFLSKL